MQLQSIALVSASEPDFLNLSDDFTVYDIFSSRIHFQLMPI